MGRPKNKIVWDCYTKINPKGVKCNYCKKEYMQANVNKMESHLMACIHCPREIKSEIRGLASASTSNSESLAHGSELSMSSIDSDGSGRATPSTSARALTPRPVHREIDSFFDKISAPENVRSYLKRNHKYSLDFYVPVFCRKS